MGGQPRLRNIWSLEAIWAELSGAPPTLVLPHHEGVPVLLNRARDG